MLITNTRIMKGIAGHGGLPEKGCRDARCSLLPRAAGERHRVFAVVRESGGRDICMQLGGHNQTDKGGKYTLGLRPGSYEDSRVRQSETR